MPPVEVRDPVPLDAIQAARERLKGGAIHTPLVRLNVDDAPAEIYLKLENLQPVGSFKLRGAGNKMLSATGEQLNRGVWTASTGNMAQGVAWYARHLGLDCTVVVPHTASELKLNAIRRLGGQIVKASWEDYFNAQINWEFEGMDGLFIHPFADPDVMAGNGTIALEILDDLPDVEAVMVSYGGGGLGCGIASALRAAHPDVKVYASEAETAAPLTLSLAAGRMVEVSHTRSFVDAIGAPAVFKQMWPLVSRLIDGSIAMPLESIAGAIRLLVERNHVVAEGAGALPVAAALTGEAGSGKVVCVVSGGNIDPAKLVTILRGEVP
jgi:threonine dehydratase